MDSKTQRLIEGFKSLGRWGVRGLNADIAKKTGFTASYAGKVFKGAYEPADKYFISVCDAFGISSKWVLLGAKPILVAEHTFEQWDNLFKVIDKFHTDETGNISATIDPDNIKSKDDIESYLDDIFETHTEKHIQMIESITGILKIASLSELRDIMQYSAKKIANRGVVFK